MARKLPTNAEIDDFIAMVQIDANHHAPSVNKVILRLSNAVRARINLGVDTVQVYERNGKLARTCWVVIGRKRWVFSYDYDLGNIDLRVGSTHGNTIFSFNNSTSDLDINHQASIL